MKVTSKCKLYYLHKDIQYKVKCLELEPLVTSSLTDVPLLLLLSRDFMGANSDHNAL